jgi:hypothetical protein
MPLRQVMGTATGAALLLLTAASSAHVVADSHELSERSGPFETVSSSLGQGEGKSRKGVGGTSAVCDGAEHRWTNTDRTEPGRFTPGAARVEATVMELRSGGGLPLPYFHARQQQDVTLVD